MVVFTVAVPSPSTFRFFFILSLTVLLFFSLLAPCRADTEVFTGHYIVRFAEDAHTRTSHPVDPTFNGRARSVKQRGQLHLIQSSADPVLRSGSPRAVERYDADKAAEFCAELALEHDLELCEPEALVYTQATPNDEMYSQLYGLKRISTPQAWDSSIGSRSVVVAVLDTGVDHSHPDLAANMWTNQGEVPGNGIDDDGNGLIDDVYGYDFYNNDGDPMDDHGHGTHCAGIIGASGNNGLGVVGVNWQTKIMGLKFLAASGAGSTLDAAEAVDYAISKGVHVLNMSFGGGFPSTVLEDAIRRARDAGILVAAAAGNSARNTDLSAHYPSGFPLDNIISVASTDENDNLSWFSNYGVSTVDIAAPGSNILSTVPGGYAPMSGTSMAAPHVAGVAALVKAHQPSLSAAGLRGALLDNAENLSSLGSLVATSGRLNASRALSSGAGDPGEQEKPPIVGELQPANFWSRNARSGTVHKNGKMKMLFTGPAGAEFTPKVRLEGPVNITCSLGGPYKLNDDGEALFTARASLMRSVATRYTKKMHLQADEATGSIERNARRRRARSSNRKRNHRVTRELVAQNSSRYQLQAEAACDRMKATLRRKR